MLVRPAYAVLLGVAAIAAMASLVIRMTPATCNDAQRLRAYASSSRADFAIRDATEKGRSVQCAAYKEKLATLDDLSETCLGGRLRGELEQQQAFFTKTVHNLCSVG